MNRFIESVTSNNGHVNVGISNYTPYYTPVDSKPLDGHVRTRNGGFEYYDANMQKWTPLPGDVARIDLTGMADNAISWVYEKMAEEARLKELAEKYPALKTAKEHYEIIKVMVQNNEN